MGIFKRAAAICIAAALTATSMSIAAYADDVVTDPQKPLNWNIENSGSAEGYEDEAKAVLNYYGGTDTVFYGDPLEDVLTDDTMITVNSGSVDLSEVTYGYFELFKFSEDKSTLVLEKTLVYHSHMAKYCYTWSIDGTKPNFWDDNKAFYEVTDKIDGCDVSIEHTGNLGDYITVVGNKISGNLIRQIVNNGYDEDWAEDGLHTYPYNYDDYDLINVCVPYEKNEDGSFKYSFYNFLTESYVNGNSTEPKPDDPAEETYKVTADKPFTDEEFAAILEENKTKDVEITVDGVTYTFKKGEMKPVEGAEYDFGATITTDLSKLEEPDKLLTEDNFVLHIDYNYSGKLPATASIKLFVGKEYAGKTLYYSQVLENGIKFIQSAVVDNDGYITVTQDHCSEYVLTTEELKDEEETPDNTTTTVTTTPDENAAPDKVENPNTGVGSVAVVAAMAVVAGGAVMILSRKRK